MEILKVISVLLPLIVALIGAGFYVYGIVSEPNFEHSKYYTTAWIEYGINQNTLNIEFMPDLQGCGVYAMGDALSRVYEKSWLNPKIDGKPLLVIFYVRDKVDLVEVARVIITIDETKAVLHGSTEERIAAMDIVIDRVVISFNKSRIMLLRDGHLKYIPINQSDVEPEKLIAVLRANKPYNPEELTYA